MSPVLEITINGFLLACAGYLFLEDKPIGKALGVRLLPLLYIYMLFLGSNALVIQSTIS